MIRESQPMAILAARPHLPGVRHVRAMRASMERQQHKSARDSKEQHVAPAIRNGNAVRMDRDGLIPAPKQGVSGNQGVAHRGRRQAEIVPAGSEP